MNAMHKRTVHGIILKKKYINRLIIGGLCKIMILLVLQVYLTMPIINATTPITIATMLRFLLGEKQPMIPKTIDITPIHMCCQKSPITPAIIPIQPSNFPALSLILVFSPLILKPPFFK